MGNVICSLNVGNFNFHCFQNSLKFRGREGGLLRFVFIDPCNGEFFHLWFSKTCACYISDFLAKVIKVFKQFKI